MASSLDFDSDGDSEVDENKKELNDEGVQELEDCSEDEVGLLNGLFHQQIEDYEVFHHAWHMLQIEVELGEKDEFSLEYKEYKGETPE